MTMLTHTPIHTTNNVPVLQWPARSTEHIWDELNLRLLQRHHAPNNVNELTRALKQD